MNYLAQMLAIFGCMALIPLIAFSVGMDEPKERRRQLFFWFAWAIVFGPFVLRTWIEALLS